MSPAAPAAAPTLRQTFRDEPTGRLLDLLLTAVRDTGNWPGRAAQVEAAAAVLQRRCGGRPSVAGTRDTEDPGQHLAERVDTSGGFLAISSDELRRDHLGAAALADHRARERDPEHAVRIRTHAEILEEHGLAVFPGVLAGMARVLVYETETLLGQLITAVAAGLPTEELAVEVLERATAR
ncbi:MULTISPECIES: hypothetical protein [unclassified Streptomyces]|uniref:hypothetical protein n=1 Tax=unclassified Streptomyces TaxID=2593676 RepID=UPI000DAD76A2|nr:MULTISPECIES: hypothetical protein [unclassified Streptomyces]PZT74493.1 hypothetical protein DNK55_20540 [Streptomyces sp. AC1-42T]PZT82521.1 hypothetical protein DNK56_10905 [Streptomyces sp. AC1-42W]